MHGVNQPGFDRTDPSRQKHPVRDEALSPKNTWIGLIAQKLRGLALIVSFMLCGVLDAEEGSPDPPSPTGALTQTLLANAVGLPHLPDQASDEVDNTGLLAKVVTLLPMGQVDLRTAKLSLDCSLISQRGVRYQINRQSDSTWLVFGTASMSPIDSAASGERAVPIGRAWLGETGLQFAWADDVESRTPVAQALEGAVLLATDSDDSKQAVAFRESIQWSPMPLDMTRSPTRVELPIRGLPGDVGLTVEIDRIESSGPTFRASGSSEADGLADRDSVKRSDAAQTEIELRLQRQGSECTLETRFYYVDPTGSRRPFEARGVGKSLAQKKRQLEKAKATLDNASRALPNLRERLTSSLSRKSDDPREQQKIYQTTKKLQSAMKRAESLIRKNKKAIPKINEAVSQMEAIASVGRGLHRQAKIHACVYAVTGTLRVPLLRIGESI